MPSIRFSLTALLLPVFVCCLNAEPSATTGIPASLSAAPSVHERRTFQHNGHVYVLVLSNATEEVDTEEYVMEGETPEQWTQMISYQRVRLPSPLGAEHYVGLLQRYFDQNHTGARTKVVQAGKAACVFGVQYDKTAEREVQLSIAIAFFPDTKDPRLLHLIQFTIKPSEMASSEIESLIRSWQARFQSEARVIEK